MANEVGRDVAELLEYVRKCDEGIQLWNFARNGKTNTVELHGADLSGKRLLSVDFRHADLRFANLSGSSLDGANLSFADLRSADLSRASIKRGTLRLANLSNTSLAGTWLNRSNLVDAVLNGADMFRVRLSGADLTRADLSSANLGYAKLTRTAFVDANLNDADLRGAELVASDLDGALLKNTRFEGALMESVRFGKCDISECIGLERCDHHGPSRVLDAVINSRGSIPEVFLRGCGVPEKLLAYLPSFREEALQFYSCFISYSHENKSFARRLHDQLQGDGIRCWLDEHQLLPGDDIYEGVDRGIRLWDKVLLCASKESLDSWWVDREIDTAIEKEMKLRKERGEDVLCLIPLNLDGHLFDWTGSHAATLRKRLAADFTGWETDNAKFEREFEKVVKALKTNARLPPPESKL